MRLFVAIAAFTTVAVISSAQEPNAALEGEVRDGSGAAIPEAVVRARNVKTSSVYSQTATRQGRYRFSLLPIGTYEIKVEANGFAPVVNNQISLNVAEILRINFTLQPADIRNEIVVSGLAPLVDTASSALGAVVSGREILDLPLNGRNFTKLGLLQPGVVPLTSGVATSGGSLRAGQAYGVNGQRPESNNYLLDGARIVNRMDGGYALRVPVDAIAEFRILTHTASAEYGGTVGGTTTVVTRSGSNAFHGSVYEFLRNDRLDARNFFSEEVEPLKQNQFGATLGGPVRKNRAFFFAYYEGFRNREGITRSASVPTAGQREGDFSQLIDPQTGEPAMLVNYLTGQPFPGNRVPPSLLHPISLAVQEYYPAANLSPSVFSSTELVENSYDQGGAKADLTLSPGDNLSARFAYSSSSNINPLSIKGAGVPGFPVGDDIATTLITLSEVHQFSPQLLNSLRTSYFRHDFLFDKRFNRTPPRDLGFQYDSTLDAATGPPFFNVNGYASVGDPITGPRDSVQNTFELYDSISWYTGEHSWKFGLEYRHTRMNARQGIASNGFFVFAPFPASDAYANFLMGAPVVFFQAGGDMQRGMSNFDLSAFVQDEWRLTSAFTLNYGVRYEVITPFDEERNRLNAFRPGRQSAVNPDAPTGLLFPGDEGVPSRIADVYSKGWSPRFGFAWAPGRSASFSLRGGYGIFWDGFTNGTNASFQAPLSALPWTQARQVPGPFLDFANPLGPQSPFDQRSFPQPTTLLTIDRGMRPAYGQDWNLSVQRSFPGDFLLEARYIGTKGTRLPRFIEANPAVYGPGATPDNADRRRIHAGCGESGGPCDFASAGLLVNATNSTYHAAQLSFSRRFSTGAGFQLSYWFSKLLDYASSLNLAGSAPQLIAGENDLPQNPFDWRAEHGPSLFDARHRVTLSFILEVPGFRRSTGATKFLLDGWQWSGIVTAGTGTPFTVYDTANAAMQGSAPEITGFFSSRPDAAGDPNSGPRTVEQWVSRAAFRRLDPVLDAGQYGNSGRNTVRGPGVSSMDLSLVKVFVLSEQVRLQFRAECFNLLNHANFSLPLNDIASPNFGRILETGPSRQIQLGLKLFF